MAITNRKWDDITSYMLSFIMLCLIGSKIDAVPFTVTTTVDNGNNGSPTAGSGN